MASIGVFPEPQCELWNQNHCHLLGGGRGRLLKTNTKEGWEGGEENGVLTSTFQDQSHMHLYAYVYAYTYLNYLDENYSFSWKYPI